MRIIIPFDFKDNLKNFMRRAGYAVFDDPNTGKTSYTKRLSRDYYPRFHVYVETNKDNRQYINLHLDQKRPSYAGSSAHNAEYDGGQVEIEGNRLKGLITNQLNNQGQSNSGEKKRFWNKFFS